MPTLATEPLSSYQRAFEATRCARAALTVDELVVIDLDVLDLVSTILARMPRAEALRESLEKMPRRCHLEALDVLESYALALGHAHVRYMATSRSDSQAIAAVVEDRLRAFTLLVRAYDRVRHAAVFLRWTTEDEGQTYLPSLWKGETGSLACHVAATRKWS